jgi:hypothetical protein
MSNPAGPGWTRRRAGIALVLALGTAALALGLGATSARQGPSAPQAVAAPEALAPPEVAVGATIDAAGVDRVRALRTGEGHFIDLRYRVADPDKAGPLLAKQGGLALLHESSGTRLGVPSTAKTGPLRSTGSAVKGRSYFALFSNPSRVVQRGDRVALTLGDTVLETLVVE